MLANIRGNFYLFTIGVILMFSSILCEQNIHIKDKCGKVFLRGVHENAVKELETPIGSTTLNSNNFPRQDDKSKNSSTTFSTFHADFVLSDTCSITLCNYDRLASEYCVVYNKTEQMKIKISASSIFHCACMAYKNKEYKINFDRMHVGVVFQPYTKLNAKWRDYSFTDVKAMLTITARRFSLISTYGIGSAGGNTTWRDGDAAGLVPVAAAHLNKECNETRVQVFAAIWQNENDVLFKSEIRNAFKASQDANEIFAKTVLGIIFTSNHVDTVSNGEDVLKRLQDNREHAKALGLQLGIRLNNCDIFLPVRLVEAEKGLYSAKDDTPSFPKGSLQQILFNITLEIDFIICDYNPQPGRFVQRALIDLQNWFKKYVPRLTFYGQTGLPSQGVSTSMTHNTLINMRNFWYDTNKWASHNNVKMFMFEAIDEPFKADPNITDKNDPLGYNGAENHYGWWTRIDRNNSVSFVEKYAEIRKDVQESNDKGFPIIYVLVPVAVILILIVAVFLYLFTKRKLIKNPYFVRLSNEEATIFMKGMPEKKSDEENDGLVALRFPYDKSHEIAKDKFSYDKTIVIGSGSSGIVYKGKIQGIDHEIAFKTTGRSSTITHVRSLLSEIKLMNYIGHHDNIVKFVGAHTENIQFGEVYLALEFCSLGNLENHLRQRKYSFISEENPNLSNLNVTADYVSIATASLNEQPEKVAPLYLADLVRWCCEISDAMDFISKKKIVHADLACRNILLTCDQTAKLTDFGLSRKLYKYAAYLRYNDEEPLPWKWMAPESLTRLIFSTKTDVWAFGITLWEIFSLGDIPYAGLAWNQNFARALELGLKLPQPLHATTEIYNQMCQCWNADPAQRIQFKKLKETFQFILDNMADSGLTIR